MTAPTRAQFRTWFTVAGKEFLFNDRGETELRGFEDPVRVYEVRWREE